MSLIHRMAMDEGESSLPPEVRKQWGEMFQSVEVPPETVMAEFEREALPALLHAATVARPGKKTTSPRAAQELCFAAAYCLERSIPIPAALRDWIIGGLRAGIAGRSVDATLGLKRGAGQSKDEDPLYVSARERRIAVRILGLVKREGLSDAQAKECACKEFDLDTRRIEQIWNKYRPAPDAFARWEAWQADFFALMNNMPKPATGAAYQEWWHIMQHHLRWIGIDWPPETK